MFCVCAQRNSAFSSATLVLYVSTTNLTMFIYTGSSVTSSYVKGTNMVTRSQDALWAIVPTIRVLWPGHGTMVGRRYCRRMGCNTTVTGCSYFPFISCSSRFTFHSSLHSHTHHRQPLAVPGPHLNLSCHPSASCSALEFIICVVYVPHIVYDCC
jgi:hypothetical protein